MDLLEIVKSPNNNIEKINDLKKFCEEDLGKGTIICNDTPGFLGNRIGVYAMQVAMTEAFKMNLTIEEADAVFGRPMGIPKTGVFGLYDLIGIDLMADVLKSFIKELSENDPFQEVAKENPLATSLAGGALAGLLQKGQIEDEDGDGWTSCSGDCDDTVTCSLKSTSTLTTDPPAPDTDVDVNLTASIVA